VSSVATVDVLAYPIVVSSGTLGQIADHLREHAAAHRYAIVSDENVAQRYLGALKEALVRGPTAVAADRLHSVIIPAGEQSKTREQWAAITDELLARGCGRDTTIIALGGGVIGDLAGFVAATYMRGVPVVHIPTTLLAMVDASVGGKTAVDTPAGKNTVGAFHPPRLVVIDPATLVSLPTRELRAGLAEVIKHGVIANASELDAVSEMSPSLFSGNWDSSELESLIERSVRIKANIVARDERELGLRKVLNFGHTIGHGVEAASDYSLLHGEAVAIGMVAEARLAELAGVAENGTAACIERVVSDTGLPTRVPAHIPADRVLSMMRSDKKQRRGALEYALPKRIGEMSGETSGWSIPIADAMTIDVIRSLG